MYLVLRNKEKRFGLVTKSNKISRRNNPYWFDVYGELACAVLLTAILVAEILTF